jgi:hypothetical protein
MDRIMHHGFPPIQFPLYAGHLMMRLGRLRPFWQMTGAPVFWFLPREVFRHTKLGLTDPSHPPLTLLTGAPVTSVTETEVFARTSTAAGRNSYPPNQRFHHGLCAPSRAPLSDRGHAASENVYSAGE